MIQFFNVFENYCVGYPDVTAGNGISLQGKYPFLLSSELLFNSRQVHTFLFTEKSEVEKSLSTNNYVSLIASNTDMRNKESWFPFVYGESKSDANFSTQSKAFAKTKLNSYSISEVSPKISLSSESFCPAKVSRFIISNFSDGWKFDINFPLIVLVFSFNTYET